MLYVSMVSKFLKKGEKIILPDVLRWLGLGEASDSSTLIT